MRSLKVPFSPTLDGIELKDTAILMETAALRQSIDIINWPEYSYKPIVVVDIARGKNDLYLHYFVRGLSLRALADKDGEYVHPDSCVEFFMRKSDRQDYTNFEFNCIGTCLAARGADRHKRTQFTDEEYRRIRRYTSIQRESFAERIGIYSWELTVAIPFELMGLDAAQLPSQIRGNFYKCADETANPHYVTWSPIELPKPDYHCPEHFGEIRF